MAEEKKNWIIRIIPAMISTKDKDFIKILEELERQCSKYHREWSCEVFIGSDHSRHYDATITVLRVGDGKIELVPAAGIGQRRQEKRVASPEGLVTETLELIVDSLVPPYTKKSC